MSMRRSQWGAGRGPYGISWAVYRDGERIDWAYSHPITRWGARLAARWFAWKERCDRPVPPYDGQRGVLDVVSEPDIPLGDLRSMP